MFEWYNECQYLLVDGLEPRFSSLVSLIVLPVLE